jgi:RNA 3'-phosphate cyclase
VLELDGSRGEGGGQVLRTALALSAVTRQPCRVVNVRAGRPEPGLRAQHVAVASAFARCTGGRVEGAEVGSRTLAFEPGPMAGGELDADIGTAGNVPLLLQALLPALAASGSFWRLTVTGGTDGAWAPSFDYFARVHVNTLERLGFRPRVKLVRRGFWPRGGGACVLECGPWQPRPFDLQRTGQAWRVGGRVAMSRLPDDVAARVRTSALGRLAEAGLRADVDVSGMPALDPGVALTLWADDGRCLLGADALGERGVPGEEVGRQAAERLVREVGGGGSVDVHGADQLLVYAALAARGGPCAYTVREVSAHLRTNAEVVERFLPVRVRFSEGSPSQVSVLSAAD